MSNSRGYSSPSGYRLLRYGDPRNCAHGRSLTKECHDCVVWRENKPPEEEEPKSFIEGESAAPLGIDTIIEEEVAKQIQIQLSNKEHFIARYLAATGAKIEDTVLIEQRCSNGIIKFWCEPKI